MIEIRFHGRGGQGAVTAAELLAKAVIAYGGYAQGFPDFGPERRGAPVKAFLRVSATPIYLREPIDVPDVVVALDPSLLDLIDVCKGLKPDGTLVVNCLSTQDSGIQNLGEKFRLARVDAETIALQTLGLPIVNTAMIGALVRSTGVVAIDALEEPVRSRFGAVADKNLSAMKRAYEETVISDGATAKPPVGQSQTGQESEGPKALHPWKELPLGGDVIEPGSSVRFLTGNWRTTGYPVVDYEECVKCSICWIICPDIAFTPMDDGYFEWNANYCKGCGACVEECPKGAIVMRDAK